MARNNMGDRYPKGRMFVLNFGDSTDLADRAHEQALAGGGYYADNKFVDTDSIPAGEQFSPEVALIIKEELNTERWREFRKKRRSWQIVMGLSCSGRPKSQPKLEREFRAPFSESERIEFIRHTPLMPVH